MFPVETEKSEHYQWILNIRISLGTNFHAKLAILDQICTQRVFPVENRKSDNHHSIRHIRIGRETKFQLKQTIFDFFDQICPKRVFPVEKRKIALLRVSMVVIYYIKLFCTGADVHNDILMSLFLLVAEIIRVSYEIVTYE